MEIVDQLIDYFNNLILQINLRIIEFFDGLGCLLDEKLVSFYNLTLDAVHWACNLSLFNTVDFKIQNYVNMIPHDIQVSIGAIGLNHAFTLILSAFFVRLSLRCIPFVRGIFS